MASSSLGRGDLSPQRAQRSQRLLSVFSVLSVVNRNLHEILSSVSSREDSPCFGDQRLDIEIARTDVRKNEPADACIRSNSRRVFGCRVPALGRLARQIARVCRFVNKNVRATREIYRASARSRIGAVDDAPATAPRPHHLRASDRAISKNDILSALKPAVERTRRNRELTRSIDIERARPIIFDHCKSKTECRVIERRGDDAITVAAADFVAIDFEHLHFVSETNVSRADHVREVITKSWRAVHGEWRFPSTQTRAREQPG